MTNLLSNKYLIAIHRALTLTYLRYAKLRLFFHDDWEQVWNASIADLQASGIDIKGIENFIQTRKNINPDREVEKLQKCGADVLVYGSEDFPSQLENIPFPPVLLFCLGKILPSDFPSISVVGSRKMTSYGQRVLDTIVGEIAGNQITIVSGLAIGVDAYSHKLALDRGSRTIAVLGNGINEIYPRQNIQLAQKILVEDRGAIMSEYLPGTEAKPEFFPIRNRIVSGLSKATIIIEAATKSGSLITAQSANDQGREIFAVPGEIFSPNSSGTNQLICDGVANPAISAKQVMEGAGFGMATEQKQAVLEIPEMGVESEILKLFGGGEKLHIDDLIRKSDLPNTTVSSNIMILEVKGLVKNIGNQVYVRNY